jgi:hypothetical protein
VTGWFEILEIVFFVVIWLVVTMWIVPGSDRGGFS